MPTALHMVIDIVVKNLYLVGVFPESWEKEAGAGRRMIFWIAHIRFKLVHHGVVSPLDHLLMCLDVGGLASLASHLVKFRPTQLVILHF